MSNHALQITVRKITKVPMEKNIITIIDQPHIVSFISSS
jgi:hypothetical protein